MRKTVLTAIIFYVIVLMLILFAKPDFLYDHVAGDWKNSGFMNLQTFSIILGALIFVYIKKTVEG